MTFDTATSADWGCGSRKPQLRSASWRTRWAQGALPPLLLLAPRARNGDFCDGFPTGSAWEKGRDDLALTLPVCTYGRRASRTAPCFLPRAGVLCFPQSDECSTHTDSNARAALPPHAVRLELEPVLAAVGLRPHLPALHHVRSLSPLRPITRFSDPYQNAGSTNSARRTSLARPSGRDWSCWPYSLSRSGCW